MPPTVTRDDQTSLLSEIESLREEIHRNYTETGGFSNPELLNLSRRLDLLLNKVMTRNGRNSPSTTD